MAGVQLDAITFENCLVISNKSGHRHPVRPVVGVPNRKAYIWTQTYKKFHITLSVKAKNWE